MVDNVGEWLLQLGLGKYAEAFAENDVEFEVLSELSDDDLGQLGLSLGHRRKFLKAVAELTAGAQREAPTDVPEASPASPKRAEAERRHLTVMFCDLVGSTALSAKLDPEDMGEVVRSYQARCTDVVKRWEGHVAKFMGDGVLVYFGYPRAHEDDAERAVRAALELTDAVGELTSNDGEPLAARVGIATGLVMVGELVGEGTAQERAVVGETPNLAARHQAIAEPGTVVIADDTRRLLGDLFKVEDLGELAFKGVAEPVRVWRVIGEQRAESRFEATHVAGLTPFVGREEESDLLLRRWEQAKDGEGQVVLLSGEPGIGKSRLVKSLHERIATESHTRLRYQCSPYHVNSALHPAIRQLELATGFAADDTSSQKLDKLEALLTQSTEKVNEVAPLFATLLSVPTRQRYPQLDLTPQRQKDMILQALVDQLIGLAQHRPVLFVLEDVHWIDPTTQELVALTIDRIQDAAVLAVITFRPDFVPPWSGHTHITTLTLNRFGRRHSAEIVARVTESMELPAEVLDQIVAKTDGVPLFVEELTKTVLEAGLLEEVDDRYELTGPLPPLAIPATLHDALMARLDRSALVKELAQIGAVIGREFPHDLLAAVTSMPEEQLLAAAEQLVASELVFRRGTLPNALYVFKHALVQDTAYESLLKSRRQQLHARIAQTLKSQADAAPELLAHHYSEAGLKDEALPYWQLAGERATQRSSNREAVSHLRRALALLEELPAGQVRDDREFELLIKLGPALMGSVGWSDVSVRETYERAQRLCRDSDRPNDTFMATWGLWMHAQSRSEHRDGEAIAETLLASARQADDTDLLLQAHHAAWTTCLYTGRLAAACEHINRGIALYDVDAHGQHALVYAGHDPGVCGYCQQSLALWLLGYPDQAEASIQQGVSLAQELQHAPTIAHASNFAARFEVMIRNPGLAASYADTAIALGEELGLPVAHFQGSIARGWTRAQAGDGEAGLAQISEANARRLRTNHRSGAPHYLGMFGEAYLMVGQLQGADGEIDEALRLATETEERIWEAELLRLRGEIRRQQRAFDDAEANFRSAIESAAWQDAKSLELRATLSLARLWAGQGKRREARDLLQPIYDWFTEGFTTPDLKDAKAFLDHLH